jgi:hypothetical protein
MIIMASQQLSILIFSHSSQRDMTHELKNFLASQEVFVCDETRDISEINWEELNSVILLYTPQLDQNETLFQIVKKMEQYVLLERFLFLPKRNGTAPFPTILHSLRFLEHHLSFYPEKETLNIEGIKNAIEEPIRKLWEKLLQQDRQNAPPDHLWGRLKKSWKNPVYRMMVLLVPVFVIFILLFLFLFSNAREAIVDSPTVTPEIIDPPTLSSFWINETFESEDISDAWNIELKYKSPNYNEVHLDRGRLEVMGYPQITDAYYQLESKQHWPIDRLQAVQVSFWTSSLTKPETSAGASFLISIVNQPGFVLGCELYSGTTNGSLVCSIQEEDTEIFLSAPVAFSLSEWHTITLAFDPDNYALQYFLDGSYYGFVEIPTVEYWLNQDITLSLKVITQALNAGDFYISIDDLLLAHQP